MPGEHWIDDLVRIALGFDEEAGNRRRPHQRDIHRHDEETLMGIVQRTDPCLHRREHATFVVWICDDGDVTVPEGGPDLGLVVTDHHIDIHAILQKGGNNVIDDSVPAEWEEWFEIVSAAGKPGC